MDRHRFGDGMNPKLRQDVLDVIANGGMAYTEIFRNFVEGPVVPEQRQDLALARGERILGLYYGLVRPADEPVEVLQRPVFLLARERAVNQTLPALTGFYWNDHDF